MYIKNLDFWLVFYIKFLARFPSGLEVPPYYALLLHEDLVSENTAATWSSLNQSCSKIFCPTKALPNRVEGGPSIISLRDFCFKPQFALNTLSVVKMTAKSRALQEFSH